MPSTLPDGEAAPADGSLPAAALGELAESRRTTGCPFGIYLHVPFCASRCGYCDFNTYTAAELDGTGPLSSYAATATAELALARRVLGELDLPVSSVFVGGGTPTLLPAAELVGLLDVVRREFGLAADAEVTTEANPESVDERSLAQLRAGGFTRISFGMQSAREHVLAVLDRRHTPGRAVTAVAEAHAAGFEHVNLDLIYGAPGETDEDWRVSLATAVDTGADHVSAYALIVEAGTRLARQVSRGELPDTDDDVLADRYLIADETLRGAGFDWYEVSNWATSPAARCRHNEGYWRSADWWGVGPGAHSHLAGVRWWNVKHPTAYAGKLAAGASPAYAREVLDAETRRVERVLLGLRLADGHPLADLSATGAE
ncbi:MAG: radical SAM family heme chaperone HemW, partial [Actinomycetota bacterium]|nr:radical SAM family heme chaperone HemW [Actinomycetota bacterium]